MYKNSTSNIKKWNNYIISLFVLSIHMNDIQGELKIQMDVFSYFDKLDDAYELIIINKLNGIPKT